LTSGTSRSQHLLNTL